MSLWIDQQTKEVSEQHDLAHLLRHYEQLLQRQEGSKSKQMQNYWTEEQKLLMSYNRFPDKFVELIKRCDFLEEE